MKKCKIDYTRFSSRNLSKEELLSIVDISKNIRLFWDKDKYVEFIYHKKSKEYPITGFYPQSGDFVHLSEKIEVKPYNTYEFLELYKTSIKLIALDVNKPDLLGELFDNSDVIWYTDYSQLISFLESNSYVSTYISENWLSVDGRKFKINKKCVELVPQLKNYTSFYEVDSLGTTLFTELTIFLEKLYDHIQKSLK